MSFKPVELYHFKQDVHLIHVILNLGKWVLILFSPTFSATSPNLQRDVLPLERNSFNAFSVATAAES